MIFVNTGDVVQKTGRNFFCTSINCALSTNRRYLGLLGTEKTVWQTMCENGCGLLALEEIDPVAPMQSLVRAILLNGCGSSGGQTELVSVVTEFVNAGRDMVTARNLGGLSARKPPIAGPYRFMGYLANQWLPLLKFEKVSAAVVARLAIEGSEKGIIFTYGGIRLGVFDSVHASTLYCAASYIEYELQRHEKRLHPPLDESFDPHEVSISGLIEFMDKMLFDVGNPLGEIRTITRILAQKVVDQEERPIAESVLRKAVGLLWLLKDACCEIESDFEKLRRTNKQSVSLQQ